MTMASGLYGPFLDAVGDNDKAIDLSADTIKFEFLADAYTPNFDTHDEEADLTNEVTGTGYTTGGEPVSGNSWATVSGYQVFDHVDISLANTTLTGIKGIAHFDDTIAGDPLLDAVNLPSTYNTSNGTIAIQLDANGLYRIKLTP